MKRKSAVVSLVILALCFFYSNAYAHYAQGGRGHKYLDEMFFEKAHFIVETQEELGYPDEKIDPIRNLVLETKKTILKQDAEIMGLELDIKAKLHDYSVDVDAAGKLVDQKYELEKAKEKVLVGAIAKMKSLMTKEEYDKMHKLEEEAEKKES